MRVAPLWVIVLLLAVLLGAATATRAKPVRVCVRA
jgi:hypothetical protein